MAIPSYMSITGKTQGNITEGACSPDSIGTSRKDDMVDMIRVLSYEHVVEVPSKSDLGQGNGSSTHSAIRVTKLNDKTSPLLIQALLTKEPLLDVKLSWYRSDFEASPEDFYIIELKEARIVKVRSYMETSQDANNMHAALLDDVYITYDHIKWSHKKSNTFSEDDLRKLINK